MDPVSPAPLIHLRYLLHRYVWDLNAGPSSYLATMLNIQPVIKLFVNLKSNSALKSNKGTNLLKSVFPSNNVK